MIKNKSKNKGTKLHSDFYFIVTSNLSIAIKTKDFSLNGFGPFINAFMRHFPIRTNRGNKAHVFLKFLKFYIAYYLMHSTSFTRWLYTNNLFISCPAFTYLHLLRIICEVKARNKIVGFTTGRLEPTTSGLEIIELIRNVDHDDFIQYIKHSDFVNIVFTEQDFNSFIDETVSELEHYVDDDSGKFQTFNFILDSLALPQNFVFRSETFPLYTGILDYGTSVQLGIYRFRNTTDSLIFSTNQGSIAGLSDLSLETFANFLRLFEPNILIDGVNNTNTGTSDLQLDVSVGPLEEVWYQYFNVSTITKKPKNKSRRNDNSNSDTEITLEPETTSSEVEASGPENFLAFGTPCCSDGMKYIPFTRIHPPSSYITYSINDAWDYDESVAC